MGQFKAPITRLLTYLIALGFSIQVNAVEPAKLATYDIGPADHQLIDFSSFLGISEEMSLWEGGVIKLAYNHSGARSDVTATEIIDKLQIAFDTMENLADLDFQFQGESTADPVNFDDGIVTIGWEQLEGNTIARAGPSSFGFFSTITRLGYLPNVDGSFRFNSLHVGSYDVSVMIHELMHLIGFGHSENPVSIMTPLVTRYDSPQPDDIAALQALYGPPDTLVIPQIDVQLNNTIRQGFELNQADSGLVFREANASDQNAIAILSRINSSNSAGDEIFLRLNYDGAIVGETVEIYITDPSGFTNLDTSNQFGFNSRIEFFFIGNAEELMPIAGDWLIQVGVGGALVHEISLNVEEFPISYNQNPTAILSATTPGNGLYNLSVITSDPEGDNITIDWHIPGEGPLLNQAASINTLVPANTPARMYAAIRDNGAKKDGSNSGVGFGALVSQYLVTPAEPNVPTYFVQEQILHVPSVLINGQAFAINFKLTALDGIQFKLVDLYPSTLAGASASLDLGTLALTLPRIIIQDNGVNSEVPNLTFDFVAGSQPIKFGLRQ